MKRSRKAKILATLGPASSTPDAIEALFKAGADAFRLNFSHGTHEEQRARFDMIRRIEERHVRPIGILADLQGPKLRVARFVDGRIHLTAGETFRLDLDPAPGTASRVQLPHPEIFAAIREDADLLLDDGRIRLRVKAHGADFADTQVITGGDLSDHKGLNVPGVVLPISPLTDKDRADLAFALELGVDWLALSFVQRPEDVEELRRLSGNRVRIMSKLEKPAAIDHLEAIIALSDGIMVARGDLGVECPPETVPILQKRILRATREAGKPVVVATQMLDSMIHAPAPTRAEASDVATAIYDGADAVMLSAETASGDYPLESVTIMDRIIDRVEADQEYRTIRDASRPSPTGTTRDAISAAARQVAQTLAVGVIVTYTSSGSTTLRAARERPDVPILCLTCDVTVARQMALVWGSNGVVTPEVHSFGEMVAVAIRMAEESGFAKWQDQIVITAGVPFGTQGTTNILRVAVVEET
ncbi:MAG: pyruvate kinase [Telmatospirillum sp.]|nr:pyruvate kinase [Telmatospirillum sp.]